METVGSIVRIYEKETLMPKVRLLQLKNGINGEVWLSLVGAGGQVLGTLGRFLTNDDGRVYLQLVTYPSEGVAQDDHHYLTILKQGVR